MSPSTAKKNATQFLKAQAEIIKRFDGKAPKLSGRGYKTALNETIKTFQSLSGAKKAKQ